MHLCIESMDLMPLSMLLCPYLIKPSGPWYLLEKRIPNFITFDYVCKSIEKFELDFIDVVAMIYLF